MTRMQAYRPMCDDCDVLYASIWMTVTSHH